VGESVDAIKAAIDGCSSEERKLLGLYLRALDPHPLEELWGVAADTILSAISRSSDITKRGVRGIIAEAIFVVDVVSRVAAAGWNPKDILGDHPYDVLLEKGRSTVSVQVKLQRSLRGKPMLYYPKHYQDETLYVVEVQKTRSGTKTSIKGARGKEAVVGSESMGTVRTRPYSFGDFDILAVNMHPASGNWSSFRYTLGSWLRPRPANPELIEIFQSVPDKPNGVWTDDLTECLAWFEAKRSRPAQFESLHIRGPK
jgi:hypothetical protein